MQFVFLLVYSLVDFYMISFYIALKSLESDRLFITLLRSRAMCVVRLFKGQIMAKKASRILKDRYVGNDEERLKRIQRIKKNLSKVNTVNETKKSVIKKLMNKIEDLDEATFDDLVVLLDMMEDKYMSLDELSNIAQSICEIIFPQLIGKVRYIWTIEKVDK